MIQVLRTSDRNPESPRREIAIVGAGNAAVSLHLPALWRKPYATVVAICDVNLKRAEEVSARWGIPRSYSNFEKMLGNEPDALIDICTPPDQHLHQAVSGLEAGHDVVLEKPMATTAEGCKKILEAYSQRRTHAGLYVVHSFLFLHEIRNILMLLNKLQLNVLGVDLRMLHTVSDSMLSNKSHWVHTMPGGRFAENLIHPVYTLRHLIGKLTISDVYTAKRGPYEWVPFDEVYLGVSSSNRFGSAYVSFNSPRWTMPFSLTIFGEEALITYDGTNRTIQVRGPLFEGYIPFLKQTSLRLFWDSIMSSGQMIGSNLNLAVQYALRRYRSGHEEFFRAIFGGERMPYTPEEAYDSTITYLECLQQLEKVRQ